jgi:hypothetical protein
MLRRLVLTALAGALVYVFSGLVVVPSVKEVINYYSAAKVRAESELSWQYADVLNELEWAKERRFLAWELARMANDKREQELSDWRERLEAYRDRLILREHTFASIEKQAWKDIAEARTNIISDAEFRRRCDSMKNRFNQRHLNPGQYENWLDKCVADSQAARRK